MKFHRLLLLVFILPKLIFSSDSTSIKKISVYDKWYYEFDPSTRFYIDSTIFNLEEYNHCQKNGIEYNHLGNLGSPAYSVIFKPINRNGFREGIDQFDIYRFKRDSVKYYHVKRPYAQLSYVIGLGNEQRFNGKFANQHKNMIWYGVEYDRLYSKGTYTNQKSNHNGFSLYAIFHSPDKKWDVQSNLLFNSFQMGENGGVTSNIFKSDTSFLTKKLSQVNSISGKNLHSELSFILKGNYNLGRTYKSNSDSLEKKIMVPMFKIGHEFNLTQNKYRYSDIDPDSIYHNTFIQFEDSAFYSLKSINIGNRIFLQYTGQKLNSDSTVKLLNFNTTFSAGVNQIIFDDVRGRGFFTNSDIDFKIQSQNRDKFSLFYAAGVNYQFSGYNKFDLGVNGMVGYNFKKWGTISADVIYNLKEAPFVNNYFRAKYESWVQKLPKMNLLKIGGIYENEKIGIRLSIDNYIIKNFHYFSSAKSSTYDNKTINVLIGQISNRFSIKGFHIDNDIFLQYISSSSSIRLPFFVSRHSIYYDVRLFKKALWLSTGFDLRYNSPFTANGYYGLTNQFYLQNNERFNFYPVLDFFLNFKIKTVRVFLKVDNISSTFGPKGYFNSYLYPSRDISFKVGITWRFYE